MSAIPRVARAIYNFCAGDIFILASVVVGFVLVSLLVGHSNLPNPLVAAVFIACIAAGPIISLGREVADRRRPGGRGAAYDQ